MFKKKNNLGTQNTPRDFFKPMWKKHDSYQDKTATFYSQSWNTHRLLHLNVSEMQIMPHQQSSSRAPKR